MGIFGWSYPPGCSGPPDDFEPPPHPQCVFCGSFLPLGQDRWMSVPVYSEWTDYAECKDRVPEGAYNVRPIEGLEPGETWWEWTLLYSDIIHYCRCPKCGRLTPDRWAQL